MICFFGDDFSVTGGVETTTYNLQKELLKLYGLKTDVVSLRKTVNSSENFFVLKFDYKIKYLSIIASFLYLKKKGYNVIITSYFAFNILNILLSKLLGHKAIVQEHASSLSYSRTKMFFIKFFYKYADEFIVLNKFDYDFYLRDNLKPKIFMNCYSYDKEFVDINDRNYYLILSRLDENKRVHLGIESFLLYKKRGGVFPLIVAGDGPCFNALKKKYSCSDIDFIGNVKHPQSYLKKARCLIITSRLECYPTVVIEAKYTGTPSVAFNVPSGLKDIIDTPKDGILVDDGNCELLSEALLSLDSDENLTKMAFNTYESARNFDSKNSVDAYYKLFVNIKKSL